MSKAAGFTYIEALISLSIAAFVMSLMPSILMQFDMTQSPKTAFEMDFFIFDITETHEKSTGVHVDRTKGVISFKTEKGEVSYRKYGSRIVKSVEQSGFVTVMFEVEQFSLQESRSHIQLSVAAGEGESIERLHFPK
ncbi:competence type IV pilus minor pilin ComGF [Salinicoccus luteus]|uniref:competence type IV pilus minor pilin ComGF n=1 Tax=Salinicoccus luteus TaxID=367840 RepID=UPI00068CEB83|nr:competence type IV pilus minor pilin ComGF [Salinicoccus luteus]